MGNTGRFSNCECGGTGWEDKADGKSVECSLHFAGQLHPQTYALLFDEPNRLAEEERKARLQFLIRETQKEITELQTKLKSKQENLVKLQLELVNRTPTVRAIQVVTPIEPEPMEIEDRDFI